MISVSLASRAPAVHIVDPVLWRLLWREAGTLLGVVAVLALAVFA